MPRPVRSANELMERASALLARRAHARVELERKLQRYAPEPAWVLEVCDRLEQAGLLNDQRFASDAADSLTRSGRYGPARISARLHRHGVSPALVHQAMGEIEADWDEQCARLVQRTVDTRGPEVLTDIKGRARLIRFLAARGFSGDVIERSLVRARRARDD